MADLDAALAAWRARASEAGKHLADAEAERKKDLKRGEKEIKRRGTPAPVRLFASTALLDDSIKIKGVTRPLGPAVTASVDVGKDDVFLRIQGPGWGEVLKLDAKKEAKAREFAQLVELTAQSAESVRSKREADVAALKEADGVKRADTSSIDRLRDAHHATKLDNTEVLAAAAALEQALIDSGQSGERWYRAAVKRLATARAEIGVPLPPGSPLVELVEAAGSRPGSWQQWMRGWRLGVTGAVALLIVLVASTSIWGGDSEQPDPVPPAAQASENGDASSEVIEEQPVVSDPEPTPAEARAERQREAREASRERAREQARREASQREARRRALAASRMSSGQHERARQVVLDVGGALTGYMSQVGERCRLILIGGQIAEALDCIDDAYDGVEDEIVVGYSRIRDMVGDTGGVCQRRVRATAQVLNVPLYRAARQSKAAVSSLDADAMDASTNNLSRQLNTFLQISTRMVDDCAPL